MLKAEITREHTKLKLNGTLPQLCADIAILLSVINKKLMENDEDLAENFRFVLTKEFMDGICFDTDRQYMDNALAKMRNSEKEITDCSSGGFADFLTEFIDFLKERRNELERTKLDLDKLAKEVADDLTKGKENEAE